MDRISGLPDDIISHILSFLPTKFAVSTTILSPRFKNTSLWASLPSLDFDDTLCLSRVKNSDEDHIRCRELMFALFVHKVVSSRRSSNLLSFRLRFSFSEGRKFINPINSWVEDVVACNVVELDLCVGVGDTNPYGHFYYVEFPACESLHVLKLDFSMGFGLRLPPPSVTFLYLRVLDLKMVLYENDVPASSRLLLNFPKTEKLSFCVGIRLCDARSLSFSIFGNDMRSLDLEFHGDCYNLLVMVDTPNLEHLRVYDKYLGSRFTFCHLEATKLVSNLGWIGETDPGFRVGEVYHPASLCDVNIDVADDCAYFARCMFDYVDPDSTPCLGLLRSVQTASSLLMSLTTSLALIRNGHVSLPIFPNLTKLEMDLLSSGGWDLLPQWLEKSPKLEILILNGKVSPYYTEIGITKVVDWQEPDSVPTCLLFHLKQVDIKGLRNLEARGLLKYLLKNGKVLKKLTTKSREYVLNDGVVASLLKSLAKSGASRRGSKPRR